MAVGMRKWCGPNHLDKVLEFYIPVNVIIYYVVISLFFLHTEKCYVYVSGSVSSSVYCLIFVSTPFLEMVLATSYMLIVLSREKFSLLVLYVHLCRHLDC